MLLRLSFLILQRLLHTMRHRGLRIAFFCLLVDALETSLFLEGHFLGVDADAAEVGHAVGFEGGALALGVHGLLLVLPLFHPYLLPLPERERLLTLLRDFNRLLLDPHAPLLVFIHDLLVPGDQHRRRHRLVSELVLNHVLFFHFLFHDHFVHFALTSVRMFGLLVTNFEIERLRYGHTVAATSH